MFVKRYFEQIREKELHIRRKREEIERLRASLEARGIDYSKDRVVSSPSDKMPSIVAKYLDMERTTDIAEENFINLRNKIIDELQNISPKHGEILYARYLEYKSYSEIAKDIDRSEKTVKSLLNNALMEFDNAIIQKKTEWDKIS